MIAHHHPSPRRGPAAQRRQLLLRNALWCAWLRRSAPDAMRASLALLREHREQRLPATLAALAGVAWVVRTAGWRLRPVQRALRRLDGVAGRRALARS